MTITIHITKSGLEGESYMSMLTLTSKMRFGAMRGCKNKSVRPMSQRGQYFTSRIGCYIGIKARLTSCLVMPTGSSGSLRGVDYNISRQWVRT